MSLARPQDERKVPAKATAGEKLILASGSPRRIELLKQIIKEFVVIPSNIKENCMKNEDPHAYVQRVSKEKAESILESAGLRERDCWVLAADTVVVLGHNILGKPRDPDHARWMLDQLQGRRHEVVTGICLLNPKEEVCCLEAVQTRVWMRKIEQEEIEAAKTYDEAAKRLHGEFASLNFED